jgi:nitroimidazol reductase NimA-like FMN-containing flavoprotein (pyridoxamine 5'-phosphate oxidase superfamily)
MTDLTSLERFHDLLLTKLSFANVAIIRKNKKPHVTPVWFNTSEEDLKQGLVYINTAKGRVKANNMEKGDPVSISILDPDNGYRYLGFDAEVVDIIEGEQAENHIDDLMFKYQGKRPYAYRKEGEQRLKIPLRITKVYNR